MMKTVSYRAVEQCYQDELLGKYHAYAIEGWDREGIVAVLADFSVEREEAEDFANLITDEALDPVHLADAAVDYLFLHGVA